MPGGKAAPESGQRVHPTACHKGRQGIGFEMRSYVASVFHTIKSGTKTTSDCASTILL
jgi:hypothetical protein